MLLGWTSWSWFCDDAVRLLGVEAGAVIMQAAKQLVTVTACLTSHEKAYRINAEPTERKKGSPEMEKAPRLVT
jgi:hypothetical protein